MLLVLDAAAQTAFPFPPASLVPNLPRSDVNPPNTFPPPGLAQDPFFAVSDPYFGPSSPIYMFSIPVLVRAAQVIGCYSGPNANSDESSNAILFGERPAGAQFIPYFMRGSRLFAMDLSTNNYCWIDGFVTPV
jgi:hypothetical protein